MRAPARREFCRRQFARVEGASAAQPDTTSLIRAATTSVAEPRRGWHKNCVLCSLPKRGGRPGRVPKQQAINVFGT